MKYWKIFVVLLAVLATASIMYAQRKSSPAPRLESQPSAAATSQHWGCPMWGWFGGGGQAASNSSVPYGPGMMYGGRGQYGPMGPGNGRWRSGQYGPMGPGMMYYGPAQSTQGQAGTPRIDNNKPSSQSAPSSAN
jgi:hypothetical protein